MEVFPFTKLQQGSTILKSYRLLPQRHKSYLPLSSGVTLYHEWAICSCWVKSNPQLIFVNKYLLETSYTYLYVVYLATAELNSWDKTVCPTK